MQDNKFIQFLWIMKYYIAPIEGIFPLIYEVRDYKLYEKIINILTEIFKTNSEETKRNLLNSLVDIYSDEKKENIVNKLSEYLKDKSSKISDIPTLPSLTDSHIDKLNFILKNLLNGEDYSKIHTDYSNLTVADSNHEDSTENKIKEQIKEFLIKFNKLKEQISDNKNKKNKNANNTYVIASTEFFNAMNHLSIALVDSSNIDVKCIRKNLHQAEGHLSRAIKDMKKLDMYLCSFLDIKLEDFQQRIKEVSPSNTGC